MTELTTQKEEQQRAKSKKSLDMELWLALLAIVCIIGAAVVGYLQSSGSIEPALRQAVPDAVRFEKINDAVYASYSAEDKDSFLNYISLGEANGYGGPMVLAVATDLKGTVTGIGVVEHRETPSWFKKVMEYGFLGTLLGKKYSDSFVIDEDVDAVSGATLTSRGMANAVLEASRNIAGSQLNLSVPPPQEVKFQFGIPEIVLLILFTVGFVGHRKSFKYTKQARWFSMLLGMVVLGFIYTNPLTISHINQLLLGFWPDWRTHLYYFMLLGGIFFVLIIDNKNPYCLWFCPFGAVQECMGMVGNAKQPKANITTGWLKWAQRALAFTTIIVALLFRNPGISSYEVFGTFFDLSGSIVSFLILGLVLVTAIFIRRPWCNFLCPIPPIEGIIKMFRRKVMRKWKKA